MAFKKAAVPSEDNNDNGAISQRGEAFNRLITTMSQRAVLESSTGNSSQMDMVARIMLADEGEFWDADEKSSIGGRDLSGVEMTIHAFLTRKSRGTGPKNNVFRDPTDHSGLYVEVTATRLSTAGELSPSLVAPGDEFVWNTSAPAVVAKLFRIEQTDNGFPVDCFIQSIDLGDGTATIKLKQLNRHTMVAGSAIKDQEPVF